MPGRKASSDSDLAVQFVLSGQGKAADAKKKFPEAGTIRNIQKRVKKAREKQEATQEKDDNAIALVYSSSLPGQMRPIGPALPRPGIPGISIQLSGMYNFPYQTQRAAHAFSAMEMQSAPPPPPILVTSASASIAAQLANRAQSKGLASDATSDDVISTVEPIDEDRITAIDGEVNGDHARESSASLSSAIGGTTNTRKRKATNNDSDSAGKAPLLIAATPVMPLPYVSSSSMQGMPAFLYRQDAGMMPVGIDNNYLQNSMPAHMPGVSAAFTGTLPGTMNAAMVAQATSSSNSSITTSSNKMPLSLQHMEFSSTQANEPIREPSFVSEDPLATSNASDTMKKKSRNGSEGLTNQGEIDKTGKSASPDKRRKLKFLTSTDNAFLLEHVPSYVDTQNGTTNWASLMDDHPEFAAGHTARQLSERWKLLRKELPDMELLQESNRLRQEATRKVKGWLLR